MFRKMTPLGRWAWVRATAAGVAIMDIFMSFIVRPGAKNADPTAFVVFAGFGLMCSLFIVTEVIRAGRRLRHEPTPFPDTLAQWVEVEYDLSKKPLWEEAIVRRLALGGAVVYAILALYFIAQFVMFFMSPTGI
ncbi:MAG: hypothetical protein Q4G30_02445 [Actinomycetaceae bacterium]|nr:hypothetical protein [Actinomycetaceae bacterium]